MTEHESVASREVLAVTRTSSVGRSLVQPYQIDLGPKTAVIGVDYAGALQQEVSDVLYPPAPTPLVVSVNARLRSSERVPSGSARAIRVADGTGVSDNWLLGYPPGIIAET